MLWGGSIDSGEGGDGASVLSEGSAGSDCDATRVDIVAFRCRFFPARGLSSAPLLRFPAAPFWPMSVSVSVSVVGHGNSRVATERDGACAGWRWAGKSAEVDERTRGYEAGGRVEASCTVGWRRLWVQSFVLEDAWRR